MTLGEVEIILGGPARKEIEGADWLWDQPLLDDGAVEYREWIGREYAIQVGFRENRVVSLRTGWIRREHTFLERVRDFLGF